MGEPAASDCSAIDLSFDSPTPLMLNCTPAAGTRLVEPSLPSTMLPAVAGHDLGSTTTLFSSEPKEFSPAAQDQKIGQPREM